MSVSGAFQGLEDPEEFGDYSVLNIRDFGRVKNFFAPMVVEVDRASQRGWRAPRKSVLERGQVKFEEDILDWLEAGNRYVLVSWSVADKLIANGADSSQLLCWNKSYSVVSRDGQVRLPGRIGVRRPSGIERIQLFGHTNDISFVH